ncbi:hypothetical protein CPC08DRAFT_673678, partial [Agrocybe pediades]
MSSDQKDLQVLLVEQQKRDMAPNVSKQVMGEMKSSLLFQVNWQELLQAGPTALSSMGACFLASSSPKAVVLLKAPADKPFKYLRYTSIQANLIECGNLGRFAFIEAESGMGTIQMTSKIINNKINDILGCLGNPISASKLLKPQLMTVKKSATQCLESAKAIEEKFDYWLAYVCEMHSACVQEEQTTADLLLTNAAALATEESRRDQQASVAAEAKAAQELLGKQVNTASEAFKKASDEYPTGWDILAQQVVGDLAGSVTTALNQAIPALVDNLNPMAKAKAATNILGGIVNPGQDGKGDNRARTKKSSQGPPQAVPKKIQDPAYPEVSKDVTLFSIMKAIVDGSESGGQIDWEKARGEAGGKSSIKYLVTMFGDAKKRFDTVSTEEEASTTLTEILTVCEKIASEINAVVEKSSEMKSSNPAKDSEQVKKWQADFAKQYKAANKLIATAKTIPGTPANGVPLMSEVDPSVDPAALNAKSTQAQAILDSAKNRMVITQQALVSSQENFVKSTELLLDQQNKLGAIQAQLSKLTNANLSLTEIKAILIECIKLIIHLKQQITNLVRFFKAMSSIVDVCVKFHVEPFLDTIKQLVAADGTDPNQDLKIGNYTLTDYQRSTVFSAAVTLRSYFDVFGEIAKMWVQLSNENIMPGLKLCDDLSTTTQDSSQMKTKFAALDRWSREATERVRVLAGQKQKEIMDGMDSRIEEARSTTAMITPVPEATRKAITDGADVTKNAAQKSIELRSTKSSLSRFS